MKKIYCILVLTALAAVSCQKPQFIESTADRDGFTSISAYFLTGEYTGMELARMDVTEEVIASGRLEIPVPYYYPEESDETTTKFMKKVKMKAELADNCKLTPALTWLDLTLENEFRYTDAKGNVTPLIITGKRTKSGNARLLNFSLTGLFDAFLDDEERIIYLFTTDDLSSCTASAEVSAHSKMFTDLSIPRNYNEPQTIVLEAHNGNHVEYVTKKTIPTKIRSGFNKKSVKRLFNRNPELELKLPSALTPDVHPSLAYVNGSLVICMGNGDTPKYIHGLTGALRGEIAIGDAEPGCVTSDECGNMLICNYLQAKGKLNIYRTSSVTEAPVLFHSYDYEGDKPVGRKIKVCGNIDGDAVITIVCGGVPSVTSSSQFVQINVTGGTVTEAKVTDLSSTGISWGAFSTSSAGVVPTSAIAAECGFITGDYGSMNINYVTPDIVKKKTMTMEDDVAWNWNPNALDSKLYNKAHFASLLILNHFPAWGQVPMLYVYNTEDTNSLSGDFRASSALVFTSKGLKDGEIEPFNTTNSDGNATISSGDVLIAPSTDGYKIFFYCLDQYNSVVTGYSADCINRDLL